MNEAKLNVLGKEITRSTQKLIIMRGIPGAGKSTKALQIVGDGIIHSTDAIIESKGDYREFFGKMAESGDYAELSRAHDTNFKNAVKSIEDGISPIVIDNTHIKANEAKKMVVKALEMGFDENNITIVDVGTGGLDAKALFERGAHGVPLEKLESMIQSHASVGELTITKILESKDMFSSSDILYSAVVLDAVSRTKLLDMVGFLIPEGWVTIAHHMTIKLGPLKDKTDIGKEVTLFLTHLGTSDMAMAVRVEGYQSVNDIAHITIAINPNGGKPAMSKDITKWRDLKHSIVKGIVTEVSKFKKKDEQEGSK